MVFKKFFIAVLLAAANLPTSVIAGVAYPLPNNPCTNLTDMLAMGNPTDGCKITATKQDPASGANFGYVHTRLYVNNTSIITNNSNQSALDKLIIYVDGFAPADAYLSQYPNTVIENGDYDPFSNREPDKINLDSIMTSEGAAVLVVKLQVHGNDSLQDSAYAIQSLLDFLKNYRNVRPIVMAGYSIGGVAVRYALADLEADDIDHNVNLYISYDAPHKGAVVPPSVQQILPLVDTYVNDVQTLVHGTTNSNLVQASSQLTEAAQDAEGMLQTWRNDNTLGMSGKTLTSTIGEQFVIGNIHNPAAQPIFAAQLLANGDNNGYPIKNIRKIAVINGSLQGLGLPPIATDSTNAANPNAYFHMKAITGDDSLATFAAPNKSHAFVETWLYKTTPGSVAAQSDLGLRSNWIYRAGCPIFFWVSCTYTGAAQASLPKNKLAPNDAKAWDTIPGSYVDVGSYLRGVSEIFQNRKFDNGTNVFTRVDYDATASSNQKKFTFLPSVSAADVKNVDINTVDHYMVITESDTPFDKIVSNGDAGIMTSSQYEITNQNQDHEQVTFLLVTQEIIDALFSLSPPSGVNNVFASAPTNNNGDLTGAYNVISLNICASIDKASIGQYAQAQQQLELAQGKADILLNQGSLTSAEHDEVVVWIDLLINYLTTTTSQQQYAIDAMNALSGTPLSCN